MFLQKFEAYDSKGAVVAGDKSKEVVFVVLILASGAVIVFNSPLFCSFRSLKSH